jgi:hypothetical protein
VPAALGRPLSLDDRLGRERRAAEIANLPPVHQVGQRGERVVDVGARLRTVDLVQVDVIRAEAPQAVLDLPHDPTARVAAVVGVVAHLGVELGGEHDVLPPARQGLPQDLLGLAG